MLLLLALLWMAADEPAPPEPAPPELQSETRFALSLFEEGEWAAGLRVPGPEAGNLLIVEPSFSWKDGQRWSFTASLAGLAETRDDHQRRAAREGDLPGLHHPRFRFLGG